MISAWDCVRDSPKFRSYVETEESDIAQLEARLNKILKLCGAMVDSGKAYISNQW